MRLRYEVTLKHRSLTGPEADGHISGATPLKADGAWPTLQPAKRGVGYRRMAGVAPCHRSLTGQVRRGIAMTTETEVVKARFDTDPNISAAAPMTTDARIVTRAIREVVMTLNAVDRAMFVVREVEDQRLATAQERFTQSQSRAIAHQRKQRDERSEDDCQEEPRMSTERESGEEA
jgi:hypothetical protein